MNKTFKFLCSLVLFLNILFICGVETMAINTNFSFSNITEEEKNAIINNLKISLIQEPSHPKSIECFDVNDHEMIALGHRTFNDATISVYDSFGIFQYGYTFNYNALFGIEWNGEYLNIYLVRSNVLIVVDRDANIIDIVTVQNTMENDNYKNEYIFKNEKKVGETEYTLTNDMGIFNFVSVSYSQLVKTSSDGDVIVIYDANSLQIITTLACVLCVCSFIALAIYTIIKSVR